MYTIAHNFTQLSQISTKLHKDFARLFETISKLCKHCTTFCKVHKSSQHCTNTFTTLWMSFCLQQFFVSKTSQILNQQHYNTIQHCHNILQTIQNSTALYTTLRNSTTLFNTLHNMFNKNLHNFTQLKTIKQLDNTLNHSTQNYTTSTHTNKLIQIFNKPTHTQTLNNFYTTLQTSQNCSNSTNIQDFTQLCKTLHNFLQTYTKQYKHIKLYIVFTNYTHNTILYKHIQNLTLYKIPHNTTILLQNCRNLYNIIQTTSQNFTTITKLLEHHKNTTCYTTLQHFTLFVLFYKTFTKLYTTLHHLTQLDKTCTQLYTTLQNYSKLYTTLQHFNSTTFFKQQTSHHVTTLFKTIMFKFPQNVYTTAHNFSNNIQIVTTLLQTLQHFFRNSTNLFTILHKFKNSAKLYTHLQQSSTLYSTRQHSTTLYNTLQHSSTLYNTLQHTTTLYNTFTQLYTTFNNKNQKLFFYNNIKY